MLCSHGLSLLRYLCGQQLRAQLPQAESTYFCIAMGVFRRSSVQFQKSITILSFCYASSFIHGYVKAFNHGPSEKQTRHLIRGRASPRQERFAPGRSKPRTQPSRQIPRSTTAQGSRLSAPLAPAERLPARPSPRSARLRSALGTDRPAARRGAEGGADLLTAPRSARGLAAARGASRSRLRSFPLSPLGRFTRTGPAPRPARLRPLRGCLARPLPIRPTLSLLSRRNRGLPPPAPHPFNGPRAGAAEDARGRAPPRGA